MSEEQKEMVVKPAKKVAFANRKYTNEERIKKEEEELAQLIEEQSGNKEEEQVEAEPQSAELNCLSQMKTWKRGQINILM